MKSQESDSKFFKIKEQIKEDKTEEFTIHKDGSLRFKGRWYTPQGYEEKIMNEAHYSRFSLNS